jgi:osmotically-inducible protein OsmY
MHGSVDRIRRLVGWTALCMAVAGGFDTTPAEEAGDRRLRDQITARLEGQVALHPRELQVEVDGGLVRLSGTVASLEEIDTVERLVQGIVGVRKLDNHLQVRSSTRSDLAIAQEIRRRLDRFVALRSPAVEAAVSEGRALVTGLVSEAVDRAEAERQARSVPGVVSAPSRLPRAWPCACAAFWPTR